jgi:hypothetical protein
VTQIGANRLSDCSSLKSILIPGSITELSEDWAHDTSLARVIFESALSLRVMIETDKVDLQEGFEIEFVACDCPLDFPGYSLQTVQDAWGVFRLVKK